MTAFGKLTTVGLGQKGGAFQGSLTSEAGEPVLFLSTIKRAVFYL